MQKDNFAFESFFSKKNNANVFQNIDGIKYKYSY